MRFLINFSPVLFLLGAAQAVFLAFVLAGIKRGNQIANRFLISLLLLFSIDLVSGFLSITYAYRRYPGLIGVTWPLVLLYGPLVYFYVKSLTEPRQQIRRWMLFAHFIPTVLFYIYLIPVFLLDPATKAEAWFFENSYLKNYSPVVDPILYTIIFQIAGYLILSLRLLKVHSKNIRQNFSSLEDINLNWLRNLIIVFCCLLLMYTFNAVFSQFYGVYKKSEFILDLMIAVIIYVMSYKGIKQPEIFTASETLSVPEGGAINKHDSDKLEAIPEKPQSAEETDLTEKYKKSALTDEQADKILAQLTLSMEKDKPYLEMGLTLPMLAKMLDISQHHISQVINEKLGKSFFDFINEYRVQETKKALFSSKAERFSILGIAMDAGFNSKSAFYTAFKKHTGMTPSQFKEHTAAQNHSKVQNPQ